MIQHVQHDSQEFERVVVRS